MTQVEFTKRRDIFQSVSVTGHAGFAEEGEDIVCAAITSAIQFLHILLNDVLHLRLDTTVDPDATVIRIVLPETMAADKRQEVQNSLHALHVHFSELEKEYARFIHVTEVQHDA